MTFYYSQDLKSFVVARGKKRKELNNRYEKMDNLAAPDDLLKFMSRVSREVIKTINAAKRSSKNTGKRFKSSRRQRRYTKYSFENNRSIFQSEVCTFAEQKEKTTLTSRHDFQHQRTTFYEEYLQHDDLQMYWKMDAKGHTKFHQVDLVPLASSAQREQYNYQQSDQYGSNNFYWYDRHPFHRPQVLHHPRKHEHQYMIAESTSSNVVIPPFATTERPSFDEDFIEIFDFYTNDMPSGTKHSCAHWNQNTGQTTEYYTC